jgi:hypothetical protein
MASQQPIDKFRQREIEQKLSSEIQSAREQIRTAATEEERKDLKHSNAPCNASRTLPPET